MKKIKKKFHDLRKYWPHLTLKQCEVERQKMSAAQNDACAICKRPEATFKKRLAVDHNHRTGKVRALLCFYCNKFIIGRHSLVTAMQIVEYLTKYDDEKTKSSC